MSASLVGSEMCIRDSILPSPGIVCSPAGRSRADQAATSSAIPEALEETCLLYTSDAADDM
eukprot:11433361-Alexandrium_andersonii.AAC.1